MLMDPLFIISHYLHMCGCICSISHFVKDLWHQWTHKHSMLQLRLLSDNCLYSCLVLGRLSIVDRSSLSAQRVLSGDTNFLLPLHYLLFHFPILFLKDVYNHLWTSLNISEHHIEFLLPMLPCLTIISRILIFFSHIVIGHPLAGLYPFLLRSPASFCKSDCSCPYKCATWLHPLHLYCYKLFLF